MFKRTILALSVAALTFTGVMYAQESATLIMKSGERVAGQLMDLGGVGFTVRVNGQERQIPTNDVAVIDFTGNGVTDADLARYITFGVSATNGYHHVHEQTKDLLTTYGIPWYRSDGNGRITFTTPGTAGGGYTVSVEKGTPSMHGAADETSSQSACETAWP